MIFLWISARKILPIVAVALVLAMSQGCRNAPNGSIVFFGQMPEPDNRTGFIIADVNGSNLRFLTFSSFTDGAVWSPDAKRLAFTKDGGLYMINSDGSGLRKVTSDSKVFSGRPSWSPDAKSLAFGAFATAGASQAVQVFTIGADGTGLNQLTSGASPSLEPSWSPDGTRIVYTFSNGDSEIYAMNASDGSAKTNLSRNPSTADISPCWDRNGFEILYLRYTPGNENERSDLYRMSPDGSNQTLIHSGADRLNVFAPSYSPDSSKIIFQGMAPRNSDPTFSVSVYTIHRDGTGLQKLIAWGYTPDWGVGAPADGKVKLYACPPFCTKPQPVPRWDPPPIRGISIVRE